MRCASWDMTVQVGVDSLLPFNFAANPRSPTDILRSMKHKGRCPLQESTGLHSTEERGELLLSED